jgi:hypothetical protein
MVAQVLWLFRVPPRLFHASWGAISRSWRTYRPDGNTVREVFIVVLDEDELVLVEAKGRLEQLIAAALRERRSHVPEFDG